MELMTVVLIISVVAVIAIVSYDSYIRTSKQANLKAQILTAASAQERHYTARGRYATAMSELVPFGLKGQMGTNGWQTENTTLYTGVYVDDRAGLSYWVAGNTDIDKTPDTVEDCWLYLSRNFLQESITAKNGFIYLYDDADNANKTTLNSKYGIVNTAVCKP